MSDVIAVDLGGTSLRVARVDRDGAVGGIAIRPHRIGPEADAETWWLALRDALRELGTGGVAGIALGGFTRSQVLVDTAGHPVRPALCFPDTRGEPVPGADAGTWAAMSPFHPVARLAWVAHHEPAALARADKVLQPKDFLALRLTGRAVSDRIANAWAIRRADGTVTPAPLARAGLPVSLLPELISPLDKVGPVRDLAGLAGVPVFTGSMDTWMAAVGAGVGRAGDAYIVSGTTDAGGVLTAAPAERPGLVTLPWHAGVFHTGGPSGAGADCLAWAAALLGLADAAAVTALAMQAPADAPPLLFLPALAGTRAPDWQPHARAVLLGLAPAHGPADIARAVLEGVAFADRDLLGGLDFDRLVLTGGGARADAWCQIRADILGHDVHCASGESGLLGAAAIAWTGLGAYPDLAAAQMAMCRIDRVFIARPAPRHARLYAAYRQAQGATLALADLAA